MQKPTYRVIPRKNGRAFDVEMTVPNCPPTIVNCFNTEADAWQWVYEPGAINFLLTSGTVLIQNNGEALDRGL